jgi:hypothetical protein
MNALDILFERVITHRFVSEPLRRLYAPAFRLRPPEACCAPDESGLISFDAFDTLITRPLQRPSDLFLLAGYKLKKELNSPLEPDAWLTIRQAAEARARKVGVDRDVTLAEIYGEIAASTTLPRDFLAVAQKIEVDLEKRLLRPIASMVESFNHCSALGRTAVISDIYFSRPDLDAMLTACGVRVAPSDLFISCESGRTKRTGTLFAMAKGGSRKHLHVGDNVFSDLFQVWRSRGRAAPFFKASPTRLERELGKGGIEPPLLGSALAGSARTARLRVKGTASHDQALAEVSAGFTAPLLLTFVVWILRQAESRGIDKLYFLARDGQILLSIAKKIARTYGLRTNLAYLHVSRQSLHLPALFDVATSDLGNFGIVSGNSLADVFRKFDVDARHPAVLRLQERHRIHSAEAALSQPDLDMLIVAIRSDNEVSRLINTAASSARGLLLEYLDQKEFFEAGNIGVVDIGWRGNLQRSLALVARSRDTAFSERLSGFYFGLYHRPENCGHLDALLSAPFAGPIRPFVRGSMFEVLCAADHGTTTGYARSSDGSVTPKLLTDGNPEAMAWGLKIQHEVVNAYVDDVLAVLTEAGIDLLDHIDGLAQAASIVTRQAVGSPSRHEADALGSFPHASDQLHSVFEEVAPPLPLDVREWISRLRARGAVPLISYWPEASVVRTMPAFSAKVILAGLGAARKLREHRRRSAG